MTRDPLAPVTQAPYAYSSGNPLNLTDLTGLGCAWYDATCWIGEGVNWLSGEIAGGLEWAWEHPEEIALGVATATLLLTPLSGIEIAVAFSYTIETADAAAALSVDIEGSLSVADLVDDLAHIGQTLGFVGVVHACTPTALDHRRNVSECAWAITTELIHAGIAHSSVTALQGAVLEWLDAAFGVVGPPEGGPRPC
jgi:hypothetical protein